MINKPKMYEEKPIDSDMMQKMINRIESIRKEEDLRQRRYGKIKPIISAEMDETKVIAVANGVYWSKTWKTFPDFLMEYIWIKFGREWFEKEKVKSSFDKHEIFKWHDALLDFQSKQQLDDDGIYGAVPNGSFKAFLLLAYDLYILEHHQSLQELVVERMKNPDLFQGARYELFATAACIRAGFDIDFEDESDRIRKHVEFIATHKKSGEKIAIEAKSRHFPGILGHPGQEIEVSAIRLKIANLINQAINKEPDYPLIVFVDLNLPSEYIEKMFSGDDPLRKFKKPLENIKKTDVGEDIFNMICFTNHPLHYSASDEPAPDIHLSLAITKQPKNVLISHSIFNDIIHGILQTGNIPNEFPDSDLNIIE